MVALPEILKKETAGLPNWAWLAVIGAGIGAAYILPKFFSKSLQPASQQDQSGLAIDPTTGLPYVPGNPGGGVVGTPGPTPPPSNGMSAQIRQAGIYPAWDQSHNGVPVRSSPGGTVLGTVGFGSNVQILGSISGPSNTGQTSGAPYSTTWYTINYNGQTAYVSAADVIFGMLSNAVAGMRPGTVPGRAITAPAWPGQTAQVRMVG